VLEEVVGLIDELAGLARGVTGDPDVACRAGGGTGWSEVRILSGALMPTGVFAFLR
jgi:hypothetical protein